MILFGLAFLRRLVLYDRIAVELLFVAEIEFLALGLLRIDFSACRVNDYRCFRGRRMLRRLPTLVVELHGGSSADVVLGHFQQDGMVVTGVAVVGEVAGCVEVDAARIHQ